MKETNKIFLSTLLPTLGTRYWVLLRQLMYIKYKRTHPKLEQEIYSTFELNMLPGQSRMRSPMVTPSPEKIN